MTGKRGLFNIIVYETLSGPKENDDLNRVRIYRDYTVFQQLIVNFIDFQKNNSIFMQKKIEHLKRIAVRKIYILSIS